VFKRAPESFQIIIRRPLDIGTDARRPNVLRTAPPRPDEVRLEQTAIGVNFSDVYCRTGYFDLVPPGGVPGIEGTGIVSDIGAGVAVMFAALLLQLIWRGRVYVLILGTSSGDVDAVTSRNKEFVSNLQKAVEQAFIVRARERSVSEAGSSR
jgi:hypothetical protein